MTDIALNNISILAQNKHRDTPVPINGISILMTNCGVGWEVIPRTGGGVMPCVGGEVITSERNFMPS